MTQTISSRDPSSPPRAVKRPTRPLPSRVCSYRTKTLVTPFGSLLNSNPWWLVQFFRAIPNKQLVSILEEAMRSYVPYPDFDNRSFAEGQTGYRYLRNDLLYTPGSDQALYGHHEDFKHPFCRHHESSLNTTGVFEPQSSLSNTQRHVAVAPTVSHSTVVQNRSAVMFFPESKNLTKKMKTVQVIYNYIFQVQILRTVCTNTSGQIQLLMVLLLSNRLGRLKCTQHHRPCRQRILTPRTQKHFHKSHINQCRKVDLQPN